MPEKSNPWRPYLATHGNQRSYALVPDTTGRTQGVLCPCLDSQTSLIYRGGLCGSDLFGHILRPLCQTAFTCQVPGFLSRTVHCKEMINIIHFPCDLLGIDVMYCFTLTLLLCLLFGYTGINVSPFVCLSADLSS